MCRAPGGPSVIAHGSIASLALLAAMTGPSAASSPSSDSPPVAGVAKAVKTATTSPTLITTVVAAERIALPKLRGTVDLEVDPLGAQIHLTAPRDLGAVAAKVSASLGNICPRWEVSGSRVVLKCRSKRLAANLASDGARRYLDIHELRGLPREGREQRLDLFYDPVRVGLGGPCPGRSPAARGECALRDGQLAEAELQWRLGVESHDRTFSALRLGDLAARRNDFSAAALMWSRAGSNGPFGRLAVARLCELRGDCLASDTGHLFDAGEIFEPVRTELALRGARVDAFAGRTPQVLRRLSEIIARPQAGGCVTIGQEFCRRVMLHALEDRGADGGKAALEVYLRLPARTEGAYVVEMARAAAARAAEIGAPVFAANLLASVAGSVRPDESPEHLLRTAEFYLRGNDQPRAQLLLEYAETRLGPRQLAGTRWAAVRKGVANPNGGNHPDRERRNRRALEILTAEATRDLANAMTALSQLRAELE